MIANLCRGVRGTGTALSMKQMEQQSMHIGLFSVTTPAVGSSLKELVAFAQLPVQAANTVICGERCCF